MPSNGQRGEGWETPWRTHGWVEFKHLPLLSHLQLRFLSVGSATFFRLPHHRAFSALPFQIKCLGMVLGLIKRCRRKFLPKSANQISLTSQSTAKRGFYVPHPSTDLPPVSCLQLRKNLVSQRKTNNKSFPSPVDWSLKTRDLVTACHFKREGTHWNQYMSSCSP